MRTQVKRAIRKHIRIARNNPQIETGTPEPQGSGNAVLLSFEYDTILETNDLPSTPDGWYILSPNQALSLARQLEQEALRAGASPSLADANTPRQH